MPPARPGRAPRLLLALLLLHGPVRAAPGDVLPDLSLPVVVREGEVWRTTLALPLDATYTLVPDAEGLRIDVVGVRVLAYPDPPVGELAVTPLSNGVRLRLRFPFPLGERSGWRAEERAAEGHRELALEFGPGVAGGDVAAAPVAPVPPPAPALPLLPSPAAPSSLAPAPAPAPPLAPPPAGGVAPTDLPPGDTVPPVAVPAAPPPTGTNAAPSGLAGRAGGAATPDVRLAAPRLARLAGLTRVTLELPPGAAYRLVPSGARLTVELDGVRAAAGSGAGVGPGVKAWRVEVPGANRARLVLGTRGAVTARTGWSGTLLPPDAAHPRARLVLDVSPALADRTPLAPAERRVPPLPRRGAALPSGAAALNAAPLVSRAAPRVVLDPGHGGKFPGAIGTVVEKDVTLDVARRVRDLLRPAGIEVVLTRDGDRHLSGDLATDLRARAALAAPPARLFVSIHVNSALPAQAEAAYGLEAWWDPRRPGSRALAAAVLRGAGTATGAVTRGLRADRSLAVLRRAKVPAALVEIGFTSHPVDGLNLRDTNFLDRVALGIALGIRRSLGPVP